MSGSLTGNFISEFRAGMVSVIGASSDVLLSGIVFNGTIFVNKCIILIFLNLHFSQEEYTLPEADFNGTIFKHGTVMYLFRFPSSVGE